MFDQFWKEQQEWDRKHPVEMVTLVPARDTFTLNKSLFLQTIENVGTMSDADLRKFIQVNFRIILDNAFYGNQTAQYLSCFTDSRFIDAFNDVLSTIQWIEKDDAIKLNTIAYHYLTLPDCHKTDDDVNKMLRMSQIVNKAQIPKLLGLGLSNNLATMILLARHSDLNLNVAVKRVDFIIITQPKELMSEKMITEILRVLYDVFNQWHQVFQYMMLDVLPEYDENNSSTWWVTEDIQEVDSTLNLAMLNILDNLPSNYIRLVLADYAQGKMLTRPKAPVRFSMQHLADDYYRINDAVMSLQYNDGVFVP